MQNCTFTLYNSTNNISIDETNISQNIDKDYKFIRPNDYKNIQWHDNEDQHLMVWFEPDLFPDFKKLYGKISTDLNAGTQYTIMVKNNYDIQNASIKKYIQKLQIKCEVFSCAALSFACICSQYIIYFEYSQNGMRTDFTTVFQDFKKRILYCFLKS